MTRRADRLQKQLETLGAKVRAAEQQKQKDDIAALRERAERLWSDDSKPGPQVDPAETDELAAVLARYAPGKGSAACGMAGCGKPVRSRGLCKSHYDKGRRRGLLPGTCIVEGCERGRCAMGLCEMHYSRLREQPEYRPDAKRCSVDGCERVVRRCGLCNSHYMKRYRRRERALVELGRKVIGE